MNPVRLSSRLPVFPWDTIAKAKTTAESHPGGICDLSVGTPVDETPALIRAVLEESSDAHGYPTTWGTPELRQAIIDYMTNRWQATGLDERNVLPVIGTKEAVAWLPTQMGLGPENTVVIPSTAYPTYDVGARLAGCRVQAVDDPDQVEGRPALIWINYPANPHGAIADAGLLRRWIEFARASDALLASDECYGEFGWDAQPLSIADAQLSGGELKNLLVVNSLSKRSNMAGYRGGYLVGDPGVIAGLLEVRKHSGMMVPLPIQKAMAVALRDQEHVKQQRERYATRRQQLITAFSAAGFRIDDSEGSLYLWVSRGENCRTTHSWLAERGILGAPGDFYGPSGARHIRIAFTATDERVQAAAERLLP